MNERQMQKLVAAQMARTRHELKEARIGAERARREAFERGFGAGKVAAKIEPLHEGFKKAVMHMAAQALGAEIAKRSECIFPVAQEIAARAMAALAPRSLGRAWEYSAVIDHVTGDLRFCWTVPELRFNSAFTRADLRL